MKKPLLLFMICSFQPLVLGINAFLFFLLGGVFPDALEACRNLTGDFFTAGFAVPSVLNLFSAGGTRIFDVDVFFLQTAGLEHFNNQGFFYAKGGANLAYAGKWIVPHKGSNFVHLFLVLFRAIGAIFTRARIQEELAAIKTICSFGCHRNNLLVDFFNYTTFSENGKDD